MRETIISQTIESLWPDQIRPRVRSPNAILKAQAMALAEQTAGVLLGEIILRHEDEGLVGLEFNIVVPALGSYRHRILTVKHAPDLPYPSIVDAELFNTPPGTKSALQAFAEIAVGMGGPQARNRADSDAELIALIARVLKSSQVLSAAQSLIARASDALGEEPQQPDISQSSAAESSTAYDVDGAKEVARAHEDFLHSSTEAPAVYEVEAAENADDHNSEPLRHRR